MYRVIVQIELNSYQRQTMTKMFRNVQPKVQKTKQMPIVLSNENKMYKVNDEQIVNIYGKIKINRFRCKIGDMKLTRSWSFMEQDSFK